MPAQGGIPVEQGQLVRDELLGTSRRQPEPALPAGAPGPDPAPARCGPAPGRDVVVVTQLGTAIDAWTLRDTLAFSEAGQQDYTIQIDENDRASVIFGDGVFGAVPPQGTAHPGHLPGRRRSGRQRPGRARSRPSSTPRSWRCSAVPSPTPRRPPAGPNGRPSSTPSARPGRVPVAAARGDGRRLRGARPELQGRRQGPRGRHRLEPGDAVRGPVRRRQGQRRPRGEPEGLPRGQADAEPAHRGVRRGLHADPGDRRRSPSRASTWPADVVAHVQQAAATCSPSTTWTSARRST